MAHALAEGRLPAEQGLSGRRALLLTVACFRSLRGEAGKLLQDFWRKLEEILDSASEGSKVVELLLDERQIHCRLLCEVRTLARRCLRMCRHPVGRHFMYFVTLRSLFKGEAGKCFSLKRHHLTKVSLPFV